jgi:drug/metabolite transporter (DMT)-like permease
MGARAERSRAAEAHDFPPIFFILFAAILWSTGGLFIKWANLSTFEISLGRSLFAALTVAFVTKHEGFGFNRMTALTSCLYAALLILFVVATRKTTAANAIFLQYTAPIYVLIFEPILFKERFRAIDAAVVAICIGGMSLFFLGGLKAEALWGNIAALASGLCMAFYFLLLRHPQSQSVNRASSVIYGNILVVLISAGVLLFNGMGNTSAIRSVGVRDAMIVLYLGIVQIGIAYTLFTQGIARGVRSLDAGIIGYIEPVLNPIWVFLFIGERPSRWAILGGAIIITAVMAHTLLNARHARLPVKTPVNT